MERQKGILYRKWTAHNSHGVVLLIHGLGGYSGRWEEFALFLRSKDISSYAIELRGFGETPGIRGHVNSFTEYYNDIYVLAGIIREENPGLKIFLAGESLGGLIGFLSAAHRPDLFDGLICIAPVFKSVLKFSFLDYCQFIPALLFAPKKQFTMPFIPADLTRDEGYLQRLGSDPLEHRKASARLLFEILRGQDAARKIRTAFNLPVLFLMAGEDTLVDNTRTEKIFSGISFPVKSLFVYPEMYHALTIDRGREKVFEDIVTWIHEPSALKPQGFKAGPENDFSFIAAAAVLTGGCSAIFVDIMLMRLGFFIPSWNYDVSGVFSAMSWFVLRSAAFFIIGVCVGSFIPWIFTGKKNFYRPVPVALGAVAGAGVGYVFFAILGSFVASISRVLFGGAMILSCAGFLIGAFLGAKITGKKYVRVPVSRRDRAVQGIVGLVIFCVPLIFTIPRTDFPATKSLQIRHQWALKKFPDHYPLAVEFIKSSKVVRDDIGDPIAVAPAVNSRNRVFYSPGESTADFTLEVKGPKGEGLFRISFMKPYSHDMEFSPAATWYFEGKRTGISADGMK
ncbi:MAG: lysophospholipase [Candidatus Omnitrophica bacterium]|nr:lysophospholipase [Candidatus Omnitrophota bacterium]